MNECIDRSTEDTVSLHASEQVLSGPGRDHISKSFASGSVHSTTVDPTFVHDRKSGPNTVDFVSSVALSENVDQLKSFLEATVSEKFNVIAKQQTVGAVPPGLEYVRWLLAYGVEQSCKDRALAYYLDACGNEKPDFAYVDALLEHSADVNALEGRCLETAAKNGHHELFLRLASHGATSDTLGKALPFLFCSAVPEDDLVDVLRSCFALSKTLQIPRSSKIDSLTYLSLVNYPAGQRILRTLHAHGYSFDWERTCVIKRDIGEERFNGLLWALVWDREYKLTVEVLEILIAAEGQYSYNAGVKITANSISQR